MFISNSSWIFCVAGRLASLMTGFWLFNLPSLMSRFLMSLQLRKQRWPEWAGCLRENSTPYSRRQSYAL
ncbi:hypothetical protein [Acidithiobacillus marinus]|uniref:hypothetical protein n=1 Tax=Acidithiobacillus marinus TaxID=187490 RepID=UPI001C0EF155|nr:hypothetical protein [Acidithiobacillus marinus]